MHSICSTRGLRHALLAPAAMLPPAALLVALIVPALGARSSHASPVQAPVRGITIKASTPSFPTQIPAGIVSVTLVSDAKGEAEASFARANPGATLAQIQAANAAARNSIPAYVRLTHLLTFIGGANSVPSGITETVVLDMRTPGLYGVDITVGNGPDRLITFNVTPGSGQQASLPPATISATLKDMKFLGLPKQLAAGTATFQITNRGPQVHEMSLVRLDAGKTQKDVLNLLRSPQGQNGPPPAWAHDMGGMDVISPQQSAGLRLNLTPGYYVALCFMPDVKKQGEPHVMEGMIAHFTVR